jgi:Concanavalin A-like lectin/glucanases superfamily
MATRLYFHAALNTLSNLPTTEQSSLTADKNGDPQSTNRLMDTTTGLSQTSVSLTTNATLSLQRYYFTAFASLPLSGITSITAQTWTYNYAAIQSNTSGNFPASSAASVAVRITLYVWRPSTQTKVGNILDGTGGFGRGTTGTVERNHAGTFTGSLVSGVQDGDVLIFEVWFEVTQGVASAAVDQFCYDGTTVQATNFSVVSNHASFIETPQNLTFGSINQNLTRTVSEPAVTISESVTRREGANRSVSVQTTTISDSVARTKAANRAVATQTVSISEAVIRAAGVFKRVVSTQVTNISESVTRREANNRSVSVQTTTIGDSVTRQKAATRAVTPQTTTISDSVTRKKAATRIVTPQTVAISEAVSRAGAAFRRVVSTQVTNISDSVTRKKAANRSVTLQTTTISESVSRQKAATRTVTPQTTTISESVTRREGNNRAVTPQTVPISESVTRSTILKRLVSTQVTNISDSVVRSAGVFKRVVSTQVTNISDSVTRQKAATRTVSPQSVTVGPGVTARTKAAIRSVAVQTVIVGGDTATRLKAASRIVATQTVTIGESVTRSGAFKRVVSQTVAVFDNVVGLKQGLHQYARGVVEPAVVIADLVTRQFKGARNVSPQTVPVSESVSRLKQALRIAGGYRSGYSIQYDGVTQGLFSPLTSNIDNLADFTIVFWINPTFSSAVSTANIINKNYSANNSFILYFTGNSYIINWRTVNNTAVGVSANNFYIQNNGGNKQYRVAVTYNATTGLMEIYVNGGNKTTATNTGVVNAGGTAAMGINQHATVKWGGNQADFRLYRRVLSAQEILDDYNGIWIKEPALWIPFNEGSGLPRDVKSGLSCSVATTAPTWSSTVLAPPPEFETVTDTVTRQASKGRIVPLESTPVGETVSRLLTAFRSIVQSITVTGSATRSKAATRSVAAQSTPVSDSVTRKAAKNRIVATQSVIVSEAISRMKAAKRTVTTQVINIFDTVTSTKNTAAQAFTRFVSEPPVLVSDFVTRVVSIRRTIVSFLTISESVSRSLKLTRTASDNVPVSGSATSQKGGPLNNIVRTVTEPLVAIADFVSRKLQLTRTVSEVVGGVPVLKPGEVPDTVKAQRAICSFLRANWSIPDPPSLDILWDSWYTGQDDITIQCEEMVTTQRPQASNWQLRTYDGFVNIHIFVREQSGLYPERLDKIRAFIDSLFSQNATALQVQGIDLMWPYIFTPIRYDKDPNWFHLIVRIQLKYFKQWPPN